MALPDAYRVLRAWLVVGAATIAASGCARTGLAPVVTHAPDAEAQAVVSREGVDVSAAPAVGRPPGYHRVMRGDTLYSIAFRYGLDYHVVAQWNGISSPYTIYPGQRLLLRPPPPRLVAAPPAIPPRLTPAPAAPAPGHDQRGAVGAGATAVRLGPRARTELSWTWPTRGQVRDASTPFGRRGIQISGSRGQAVNAAAGGQVVYSGSGLIGYGKLVIIKHNEEFLSAYAHNDKVLVAEGQTVTRGQQIAEMGDSGTKRVMLHFEIRRDGKPVAPLDYLPKS